MSASAVETILAVIRRKKVPGGQITLYKALYESRGGLSKTQLADMIRGSDEESLRGVLGALGNRVNQTPGLKVEKPGLRLLLERDGSRGELVYRMRPELREAVDRLQKLRKAIDMPVSEIRRQYKGEANWLDVSE